MGTKDFNFLDIIIAKWRLSKIQRYINERDSVLDFGCGAQAYFLRSVESKILSGIGIDYDVVDKRVSEKITLKCFRFTDTLPVSVGIDKIIMLAVLEHIELAKVNQIFDEFYRILKTGGEVIMTTPTPRGKILLEFLAFKLGIISKLEISDHKKYYNCSDMKFLAKESKFTLKEYRTFQFGMNSCIVFKKMDSS